jgi:hypothetical protein
VLIAVSLLTRPQDEDQLAGLTFATASSAGAATGAGLRSSQEWRRLDVLLSVVLVVAVVLVWLAFRG